MVIPLGLEPKTVCLEGRCSIQLSYGTMKMKAAKKREFRELSEHKTGQSDQGNNSDSMEAQRGLRVTASSVAKPDAKSDEPSRPLRWGTTEKKSTEAGR